MSIKVLKLTNGEDVLGEVKYELGKYNITNPVGIAVVRGKDGSTNVGLTPFPLHAPQKQGFTIDIPASSVLYSYEPAEDFVSNYNQVFGAGIAVPSKKLITG